jgi:hypothetical protein
MATKPRWSSCLDEWFGFEESGDSWNSPLKRIGKDLKWISWWKYFCVFIKRKDKRYKYEDELGSKKIVIIPRQRF